ncbi:MAG: TorF family putative porin [Sulfuriflexus sp.]|nr:TorF family putative porin [Sulfuriflexus sp.]
MNTKMTTLAAAVLMTASPLAISTAAAEVTFSGNVALTTDYVYRGISQTDEGAAIQGGFDLEHDSGFYAGVWASNLDFGDDADIEIDYYAGIGGEFSNKIGWDVGAIYYSYPDSDAADDGDYDFTEVYGSLSYDFGPAAVTGGLAYSSDFFGSTGDSLYTSIDVDVPLPNDFSLGLHYGNQDIDDVDDYNDWKIGVSKSYGGFDFALDYTDTDIDGDDAGAAATDKLSDDRFIFTISKSL